MVWSPRSYQKKMVLVRDGAQCRYCARRVYPKHLISKAQWLDIGLTFDHFIPRNDGGPTEVWNLFVSCYRCNSEKGHDEPGGGGKWSLRPVPKDPISIAKPYETPAPMIEVMGAYFPAERAG